MPRILLLLIALFSAPSFADQYLCVADYTTGFRYDDIDHRWNPIFASPPSGLGVVEKFLVAPSNEEGREYEIREIGEAAHVIAYCKDFDSSGVLYCGPLQELRINRSSGRFIKSYTGGYINEEDSNDDTPHIQIGRCSPY